MRKYSLDLIHSLRKCLLREESNFLTWPIAREIPAHLGYSEYLSHNQDLKK